ncbi:hypothetical protein QBC36DRAFT_180509 [Triangularia setosa]|uniref:Protein FAF1 n=1 Tax=Triangularia setosa TaxID=2587417 RepID=A0AAN6WFQ6_9PEZI|nr:hypothetical protein QBC36DRAFT_180509 [Podospora setosa]
MTSALGKRKAPPVEEDVVDAQEALRRHFEARFKMPAGIAPCAAPSSKKQARGEDEDNEEDEDDSDFDSDESNAESWDGVSSEEEEGDGLDSGEESHVVEVVDHTKSSSTSITSIMSKKELKAYLSSRPPSHTSAAQSDSTSPKKKKADESQAEDSAAFLANDLALQRLIAESHILSAAGGNSSHWQSSAAAGTATNTRAFAAGRTAKKTTDLRFQALGAKDSILAQSKMPMSMRKGIVSHNTAKEAKRRREAKENGIILEREVKKSKPSRSKKSGGGGGGRGEPREVGAPGVGRMRGATLRISAREAEVLNRPGPARRGGRGGRGGRR